MYTSVSGVESKLTASVPVTATFLHCALKDSLQRLRFPGLCSIGQPYDNISTLAASLWSFF